MAVLMAACLIAISACAPLDREPGLEDQPTSTSVPATTTPTPLPIIEVEGFTIQPGEGAGSWRILGLIRNISDDGLADLELQVSVLDLDGTVLAESVFPPAHRQLSSGDQTAFGASFSQISGPIEPDQVIIRLSSFRKTTVSPLAITVSLLNSRANFEGGTTYLGYFSNLQPEYAQIRNVEAFILNDEGLPISKADKLLTILRIDPRGRVPFQADFSGDLGEIWPAFYIDAVPGKEPDRTAPLWSVAEPQLFFTDQGIPYYLVELNNSAFAPQVVKGIFTLMEGTELVSVLPIESHAAIPAQSDWYFTLQPGLELPIGMRDDETAVEALDVAISLDPIASHGVSDKPMTVDLEVQSVEFIGGSLHLKGIVTNPTDQALMEPVVYASVRNAGGGVVSAAADQIQDSLSAEETAEFTISLWLPSGTDPTSLEFDLSAIAILTVETDSWGD